MKFQLLEMPVLKVIEERSFPMREEYKLPVFYFLVMGAFAGWQSYYNLHLDGIGFSSMQIGILNAIFIATSALVVPFWGMLADKHGGNRILIL
jgi:nitrate/nitrite transporter NarK